MNKVGNTNCINDTILNINGLNYIRVYYNGKGLKLLVDTGASISILFKENVGECEIIDESLRICVNGVTGSMTTLGSAELTVRMSDEYVNHKFQLTVKFVKDIDGILGSDFLSKFYATIDYYSFTIRFIVTDKTIILPLESNHSIYTTIPPRFEKVIYCSVPDMDDYVVIPEEVCKGVFVGSIIVRPIEKKVPVRVLNVTDEEIKLRNFNPRLDRLSNYQVGSFNEKEMSISRIEKVLKAIKADQLNAEKSNVAEYLC